VGHPEIAQSCSTAKIVIRMLVIPAAEHYPVEDVLIRRAVPGDIVAIQNVARLAWAAAYEGIIPRKIQARAMGIWYSQEALATTLDASGSLFLVAERAQTVLGFVNLRRSSPEVVHLARIYLVPDEQRKGLGALLLDAAFALLPEGIEAVTVNVEERNLPARRFYERRGFVQMNATTVDLFGFCLPLVAYEKALAR
jgi:GNAT superfamily N-acetyltransferase